MAKIIMALIGVSSNEKHIYKLSLPSYNDKKNYRQGVPYCNGW